MSTSVLQEGNGANPLLPNVDSIVPGSIFQDDIPPPTFMEGSSGYDPQTNNNTTTTTAGVATSANGRSSNNNNSGGGGHAEIEVNSTIQTVLITLGICVGALFLLGVIATHYISHKNRRAEEKNMKELEKGDGGGGRGLGEALGVKEMKSGGGILGRDDSRRGSVVTVCLDEKMDGGAGVGPDLVRPAPIKSIKGKCFTPGSSSPGSNHSPKGSIIGGVGTAVGGGGHAGTGSFQMGVSGPRGPGSVNPRNSFMEVAMPSALRAATPGYRYEHHHHHHHHAAAPPDLQLGLYADKDPFGLSRSQQQELTSPMFAFSPSGYFGTDHSDRNPFASPPLSAGSKISMLMMDPFRTQNSSQLSLNLGGMTSDDDNSPGLGYDDDDDMFSCRPQVSSITTNNNNNYNYNNANNAGEKVENNNMSNMPLSLQALSPSNGSPRSLDDLSEPKLILRHIHSAVPAYHRQSAMNTASPSSARSVTPNIFNEPPSSPVAVALATAATARVSMERHASFSPGVAHDRRSVACSVVVTSRNERQSSSSSSSSSSGSINEGNAWYRKRASVIIPEGGTAHYQESIESVRVSVFFSVVSFGYFGSSSNSSSIAFVALEVESSWDGGDGE
ncbi:hypothetical protein BGZ58_002449 [Dissophora ornata]|nr:hypothetical protein BGZ58_002449 [Dissophora ornata]